MKNSTMNHLLSLAMLVLCTRTFAQGLPFPDESAIDRAQVGAIFMNTETLQGYTADYGTVVVAEGENSKKTILLPVMRIRSKNSSPGTPIFYFAGGPGGANIKAQHPPEYLLENHDFVRVGYRGVDGSVSLACPEINKALKTVPDILSTDGLKALGQVVSAAAETLARQGIDVTEYAIANVVDDMEAARKALGYEKISLSGASFGGAVIYTYCVRYPDSIHRALLTEAAFPFDMPMHYCDWPVKPRPEADNKPQFTDVEALFVYGSADAGRSPKEKYLPYFKNGRIVIHENMGHMDVTALQPEASRHLEKMFFLKGAVDTSLFEKREATDINFVPDQRFGDMAKAFMQRQQK